MPSSSFMSSAVSSKSNTCKGWKNDIETAHRSYLLPGNVRVFQDKVIKKESRKAISSPLTEKFFWVLSSLSSVTCIFRHTIHQFPVLLISKGKLFHKQMCSWAKYLTADFVKDFFSLSIFTVSFNFSQHFSKASFGT